jgi:hypothetical protein
MKRRIAFWKILGGFLGTLILITGAFWLWVSSVADRRWQEMIADARRCSEEAAQVSGIREVLRGETLPGSAWPDYLAADALIPAGMSIDVLYSNLNSPNAGWTPESVAAKIDPLQPALDLFERGGRHTDATYPQANLRSFEKPNTVINRLKYLGLCRARLDAQAGRGREAAQRVLDVFRLLQDASFNTSQLGLSFITYKADPVAEELRRMLMKGQIPGDAFEGLERQIEVLDRTTWPLDQSFHNQAAYLCNWIEEDGALAFIRDGRGRLQWRYAFHPRLQATATYFNDVERCKGMLGCGRLSWTQERERWDAFSRRALDPLPKGQAIRYDFAASVRRVPARFRLFRSILHRRRTGEWPDLDDPFGEKILHSETETHLRAWSVGPDGVDNGGRGNWTASAPGEDLLLEVPR